MLLYQLIVSSNLSELLVDHLFELLDRLSHLLECHRDPYRHCTVQQKVELVTLFTIAHHSRRPHQLLILQVATDYFNVFVSEGKLLALFRSVLEKFDLLHLLGKSSEILWLAIIWVLVQDALHLVKQALIRVLHLAEIGAGCRI